MTWNEFERECRKRGYVAIIEKDYYGYGDHHNDELNLRPLHGGTIEGVTVHMRISHRLSQRHITRSTKEVLAKADEYLAECDRVREACAKLIPYAKALKRDKYDNPEVYSNGIMFEYGRFDLVVAADLTISLKIKGYGNKLGKTELLKLMAELEQEEARVREILEGVK